MSEKRKVEIFSTGCPVCQETIDLVKQVSCTSCDVIVLNMKDGEVAQRAKTLGIHRVPAVVVDGKLSDCCNVSAPSGQGLRDAGIGQAI